MITYGTHTDPPADSSLQCYEGVNLTIGKYCSIASGLKIISGQHPIVEHPEAVTQYPFAEHKWGDYWKSKMDGFVTIGNDVWVCEDVTILEGVTVRDGAIIGAKAVVTKDVYPYHLVAGNPAKIRGIRFTAEQIRQLLEIKWWEWEDSKVKEAIPAMKDIDLFLSLYYHK